MTVTELHNNKIATTDPSTVPAASGFPTNGIPIGDSNGNLKYDATLNYTSGVLGASAITATGTISGNVLTSTTTFSAAGGAFTVNGSGFVAAVGGSFSGSGITVTGTQITATGVPLVCGTVSCTTIGCTTISGTALTLTSSAGVATLDVKGNGTQNTALFRNSSGTSVVSITNGGAITATQLVSTGQVSGQTAQFTSAASAITLDVQGNGTQNIAAFRNSGGSIVSFIGPAGVYNGDGSGLTNIGSSSLTSIVSAGTYNSVTVDTAGRVTAGTVAPSGSATATVVKALMTDQTTVGTASDLTLNIAANEAWYFRYVLYMTVTSGTNQLTIAFSQAVNAWRYHADVIDTNGTIASAITVTSYTANITAGHLATVIFEGYIQCSTTPGALTIAINTASNSLAAQSSLFACRLQ